MRDQVTGDDMERMMTHLPLAACMAVAFANSGQRAKMALLAIALFLVLPADQAAARSIGTCYNGTTIAVPEPAAGVVDLNPYGYSICTLTVSGATIYSRYGGAIISITGDNNNLEAEHHGWGHGHGRFRIMGNHNYIGLGESGGNIDVTGTGNVLNVWDTFATEHFRCSGTYPTCGNKWVVQGRGGDWIWGANPNQGVQGLHNHDVFDLAMPLNAAGCGYGCDPTTVSRYYNCLGCRALDSSGGSPGNHIYDIPTLKRANGPVVYFFDCSTRTNTLAGFLANSAIAPGSTPENWPPVEPAGAIPPWPGGLVPNDIHVVLYGQLNFTAGADKYDFEWLYDAPVIFDPWAYANNSPVTATMTVAHGLLGAANRSATMVTKTGTQQVVNEWIVSQRYRPSIGSTDSVTLTVTNAGGGSVTTTFPITIAHGSICP